MKLLVGLPCPGFGEAVTKRVWLREEKWTFP
uniref:High-affinity nitrate transporter 3.1 n=1 Tax=Rhizophora mucronata TaxID=61149 RepID=A0A2P2IU74_RHIMU